MIVVDEAAAALSDSDLSRLSDAQILSLQSPDIVEEFFNSLTDDELKYLPYWWDFWGRPSQKPPAGDWTYWLALAGRGWGKTQTIVHWAIEKARSMPRSRGAIVAPTAGDARDVLIEGPSGILDSSPDDFKPLYEPSKRRLTWPNGTVASVFSADEPNRLRGPQFHWAIADELAAWRFMEAWDMLQFGLRLGDHPQCAIATTPRPLPIIKDLIADPACEVVRGTTYENRDNLADAFFKQIIRKYEGTRLGRQELNAELLDDVPGALWNRTGLDKTRVTSFPTLFRIAVAIDPAASTGQTGIVVMGIGIGTDGEIHGYVLDDVTPEAGASPAKWAMAAIAAYNKYSADVMVGEVNNGGAMVEHTIRTVEGGKSVNYKLVRASRGKYTRAEPVAALFEQKRCHMVGSFAKLEDELCEWVPGQKWMARDDDGAPGDKKGAKVDSPNRLDAMVWAATELMLDKEEEHASSEPVVNEVADLFG